MALPLLAASGAVASPVVTEQTLYAFTGNNTGEFPWAPLTLGPNNNLFGTTPYSLQVTEWGYTGPDGPGNAFRLDHSNNYYGVHQFQPSPPQCEGSYPGMGALVRGSDGFFYGTTLTGGTGLSSFGAVYKMSAGGKVVTLHSFNGADGYLPQYGLVDGHDGYFYGTTVGSYLGALGTDVYGTVYRVGADGSFSVIYSFKGDIDSGHPNSLVLGKDGNLYGTTRGLNGALTSNNQPNYGSVFKLTTQGVLTPIYTFTYGGGSPQSLIQASDGSFYGIVMVAPVINPGYGSAPCSPTGAAANLDVLRDENARKLDKFGMSRPDIGLACGSVFRMSASGTLHNLHSFEGPDGTCPQGGLMQGRDGLIYGTTIYGGTYDLGTVFRVAKDGTFTSLYSFTGGSDGKYPAAALIQAPSGSVFYGTTYQGGPDDIGTIFRLQVSGS